MGNADKSFSPLDWILAIGIFLIAFFVLKVVLKVVFGLFLWLVIGAAAVYVTALVLRRIRS